MTLERRRDPDAWRGSVSLLRACHRIDPHPGTVHAGRLRLIAAPPALDQQVFTMFH